MRDELIIHEMKWADILQYLEITSLTNFCYASGWASEPFELC